MRLEVEVNGNIVYSNYPADPLSNFDDLKTMSDEQRKEFLSDPSILTLRIDDYQLPPLVIKLIKSLKKNSKAIMQTTNIEKLHKNFASSFLDQYTAFKQGDTVKFTVSLYSIANIHYFYKLKVEDKLAYAEKLKGKAGDFFKQGNLQKAAKIY